jgi:hypothetical protein
MLRANTQWNSASSTKNCICELIFVFWDFLSDFKKIGGEGGIRTLGTLLVYEHLANAWIQPLSHFSADSFELRR